MKIAKQGKLNPMYGKPKSKEFIEQMYKDKTGANNPIRSLCLRCLHKRAYTTVRFSCFSCKNLHISKVTIKKYLDTNIAYKSMLFFSNQQ